MPPVLQAKMLRVIEERAVRPWGIRMLIRLMCGSSPLEPGPEERIQQGRFREDLYYRLKVIDIELPPLRERKEDIPLLVQHFLTRSENEKKRPPPSARRP